MEEEQIRFQLIFVITGEGGFSPVAPYSLKGSFKDILSADFSETLVTRVLQTRKTHRSSQITYRFHVLSPCVKLKLNKLLDKRYRSPLCPRNRSTCPSRGKRTCHFLSRLTHRLLFLESSHKYPIIFPNL